MNKRQQVEAAIREACPDLQELSFGCVLDNVVVAGRHLGDGYTVVKDHRSDGLYMLLDYGETLEEIVDFTNDCLYEIIGHPIRLSSVLRAIEEVQGKDDAWKFAIRADRQFMREWGEGWHETVMAAWPESDNLNDASEETIEFLHEVLCQ